MVRICFMDGLRQSVAIAVTRYDAVARVKMPASRSCIATVVDLNYPVTTLRALF